MVEIRDPEIQVDPVPGHPGQCLLRGSYDLACQPGDAADGQTLVERWTLRAVDEHDAPVIPTGRPITEVETSIRPAAGTEHRVVEHVVRRVDLDVQQDWWASGPGGETEPIAEWPDHVAADIELLVSDEVIATATTPTITGSWGALGRGAEE